ncbi:MAG: hypothetical protein JWO88_1219 [Frankiales bacterium]|nr:hypothetical protein [Frankiales bacterium]
MDFSSHRRLVWAAPAVVSAAVVAALALPGLASGTGSPKLPDRTASQLLVDVQSSSTQAFSGTVVETARLGLPDLPGADRSASLDWQSLISGSHTARVWADGADHQRLALIGQLAESDVVHNGSDLWTYSSSNNAVTHATLPADSASASTPEPSPTSVTPLTPQDAAAKALAAIDPSTVVAVDGTQVVADRPAYTLSLTPRDTRSTVRQVLIAVDSEFNIPLRVQVFGSGVDAAFEVGFTDISFTSPSASVFHFSPPQGATVTEKDLTGSPAPDGATTEAKAAQQKPTVIGNGWTSILSFAQPAVSTTGQPDRHSTASILDQLTTSLPNGDRLLKTTLVNAILTADGKVFVGAVTPDLLQKAASGAAG